MTNQCSSTFDSDGNIVNVGDHVKFSFGIPPVSVRGKVIMDDNRNLVVLTPGHNPDRCLLRSLHHYVGVFYKEIEKPNRGLMWIKETVKDKC